MSDHGFSYSEIEEHIARRRFGTAIAALCGQVLYEPTDARAWSLLGQSYTEAGHQKPAIAALMRAVLLDDEGSATCEALGVAWLRSGDVETARSWFHRGLASCEREAREDRTDRSSQRGSILRNLAMSLLSEERFPEAQFMLEEAHEASPRDLLTLHALSAQYVNNRRYQEASPLVERILDQPELPEWLRKSAEHRREIIRTNGDVAVVS